MKLAIYDFDGTYISAQTVPLLFKVWKKQGLNKKMHRKLWRKISIAFILYKLKLKRTKEVFRIYAMSLTIDLLHSVHELERRLFLDAFYEEASLYVNKDVKEMCVKDKSEGYHLVLLSGSYDVMLTPFLKDGFDTVIGTKSKDGVKELDFTSVEIIINEKKLKAIKDHFKHIDFKASKAIADSYYDIHILSAVGHPVAYHPDSKLYQYAKAHQMEIVLYDKNTSK